MTKTTGFNKRTFSQLMRYSYKGNAVSLIKDNEWYEVGVFLTNKKSYVDRTLNKKTAIELYKNYKRLIRGIN